MRRPLAMLCAATLAASAPVAAQEERAIDHFAGVGTRAMGMGGAFVGVADDFTAVFWNPAGLAQMARREVHVAFLRNAATNDAHLGDTPATAELSNTRFGSLGLVYPYPVQRGSFVLAAGFNRVKDFDWVLAAHGQADSLWAEDYFIHEGELSITSVAAAIDVSPSVSLGLTLSLTSGGDEATNEFVSIDTADHFLEHRFIVLELEVVFQPHIDGPPGKLPQLPEDPAVLGLVARHEPSEIRVYGGLLAEYLLPHLLEEAVDVIGRHQHEHVDLGLLPVYDKGIIKEKPEQLDVAELLDVVPILEPARLLGLLVHLQQFDLVGVPDPVEVLDKGFNFFPENGFPGLGLLFGGPHGGDVGVPVPHPVIPALCSRQLQGLGRIGDGVHIPVPAKTDIERFKGRFTVNEVTQEDIVNLDISLVIEFVKREIISWM